MAYENVIGLECDKTIGLGGFNKKLNKNNPTKIEGYYLGFKEIDSPKSKTGKAFIYVFQTAEGNVGVYGKTHLDKLMSAGRTQGKVVPGRMTLVQVTGTTPTKNGDMYTFAVMTDKSNSIDLGELAPEQAPEAEQEEDLSSFQDISEEPAAEEEIEEVLPVARPPVRRPVAAATPSRQAEVAALLANRKNRA